jgi:hypothetical protein
MNQRSENGTIEKKAKTKNEERNLGGFDFNHL